MMAKHLARTLVIGEGRGRGVWGAGLMDSSLPTKMKEIKFSNSVEMSPEVQIQGYQ